MTTIKFFEENLFNKIYSSKTIVIPHIVNSMGGWGSGFVVPLGKFLPKSKEEYIKWYKEKSTEWMGKQIPFELGQTQIVKATDNIFVCNMCAQILGGTRPLRYNALSKCLDTVADFVKTLEEFEIHAPMFGSGLAGGDFNIINELIKDSWLRNDFDVNIYYLSGTWPQNFKIQNEIDN